MTSVRLPREIEQKLDSLARRRQKSKTELIRLVLERFFSQEESEKDSYELGESYFGRYGSGDGTLSATYKVRRPVKEFVRNGKFKFVTTTAVMTEVTHMLDFNVKVKSIFLNGS